MCSDIIKAINNNNFQPLDDKLKHCSFISGPVEPNDKDLEVFKTLKKPPTGKFLHACRWYAHIAVLVKNGVLSDKKDDDFDPFADDDDEDDSLKKKQEQLKSKKDKKKEEAKSLLVIHIEPASQNTDLDHVLKLVKEIQMEGLIWGEKSSKIPIAFGIEKLQVSCTIFDELVSTDELIERIEELGLSEEDKLKMRNDEENDNDEENEDEDDEDVGLVQSAVIASFNKL